MLSFFPSPYPGEWWYSVLCRCHVRMGTPNFKATIRALFPDSRNAMVGTLFPNRSIYLLHERLPPTFNLRESIWKHTTFPYHTRMLQPSQKNSLLDSLCKGALETPAYVWRTTGRKNQKLRYCPMCAIEDRSLYGEAYWHTQHQLPLVSACPIHSCELIEANEQVSLLNKAFVALESLCNPKAEVLPADSAEQHLSQISSDYLSMTPDVGPTRHNNLAQAICNMEYGLLKHNKFIFADTTRLYHDLQDVYGAKLTERVFGAKIAVHTMNRIVKWDIPSPECYILLQGLTEMPSETIFGSQPIPNQMQLKMLSLQNTDSVRSKKELSAFLGVKPSQLNALMRNYELNPIWDELKRSFQKNKRMTIYLTAQEHAEINEWSRKNGVSAYQRLR